MTLDDAIAHAREVAAGCGECAEEHAQLADWLDELRTLKALKEDGEAMKDYSETSIDELIDEYAVLANDPIVMAYIKCSDELMKRRTEDYSNKPETEFYKAACGYEYTIELPYDELHVSHDKAWMKHHDCSFTYKEPDGRVWNACLSLCGYSREDIVRLIDKRIERLEKEAVNR